MLLTELEDEKTKAESVPEDPEPVVEEEAPAE